MLRTLLLSTGAAAATLGAYNVDPRSVSVSGLSSGGFFAAQLGVAYSDIFQAGFGVFAGGPYDCARNQYYFTCMYNNTPSISLPTSHMNSWSGTKIAPVSNLAHRKVYLQVGTADATVGVNVMTQLEKQLADFVDPSNITYITTQGAAHTFPTDFDGAGDNPCGTASSPFISNCGYDGAGGVLNWLYKSLSPRNDGPLSGSVVGFEQTGAYGAAGMDGTGYVYVPASCQAGTKCKLHVALHGCQQGRGKIGEKFVMNTGYLRWADANEMIVLFPQAMVDYMLHFIWGGTMMSNPNGCWDWVGWYGGDADQRGGVQMTAVVNQVNRILSGYQG